MGRATLTRVLTGVLVPVHPALSTSGGVDPPSVAKESLHTRKTPPFASVTEHGTTVTGAGAFRVLLLSPVSPASLS